MSCCGNKKDIPANSNPIIKPQSTTVNNSTVQTKKIYNVNDQQTTGVPTGYKPVSHPNHIGNYKKVTKDEHYWEQNTKGSKSQLFTDESALKFDLDHENGVSNTFDIPTFDYLTVLSHNIYFNKNLTTPIDVDDGNRSRIKSNSGSPNKVAAK